MTEHDRKQAALLAGEGRFAMSVREWSRAEESFAKAVQLVPDGDIWLSLGAARVQQKNRAGAKEAYLAALKAFENDAARLNGQVEPWLKQAYVLALLGRNDESRARLANAAKLFPDNAKLRAVRDEQGFEKMVSSGAFKDMAL